MTLDEAIRHAEEVADYDCYNDEQKKCADEHRQLAEWLRELKMFREAATDTDTIRRQTAIKETEKKEMSTLLDWSGYSAGFNDALNSVVIMLEDLPSAQTEIVRCKECKHRHLDGVVLECPFGLTGGEDFFCAYGAKDGDSDEQR